jgi:hypothetical protein
VLVVTAGGAGSNPDGEPQKSKNREKLKKIAKKK